MQKKHAYVGPKRRCEGRIQSLEGDMVSNVHKSLLIDIR